MHTRTLAHSHTRRARQSRCFRPTLGSSFTAVELEPRFLTAPVFVRRLPPPAGGPVAALRAGAWSYAGFADDIKPLGEGEGWDAVYVTQAQAASGEFWYFTGPPPLSVYLKVTESGSVTNKVTGPGSGISGDPNPIASSEIQVDVNHSHTDQAINYTSVPKSASDLNPNAPNSSQSTAADTNNAFLTYELQGAGTITYTFQASFSTSGQFRATPNLSLESSSFSVVITGGGLVAKDGDGNVIKDDPGFVTRGNSSETVTLTVPNAENGDHLDIRYASGLQTGIDAATPINPGTSTSATNFHWNLKVDVGN